MIWIADIDSATIVACHIQMSLANCRTGMVKLHKMLWYISAGPDMDDGMEESERSDNEPLKEQVRMLNRRQYILYQNTKCTVI